MFMPLFRNARRQPALQSRRTTRPRFVHQLEMLEERNLLSTLTVTNLADTGRGSLRSRLAAAAPGDMIVFKPGLSGSIELGSTLTLDRNVTVRGNLDPSGNPMVTLTSSGRDDSTNLSVISGVTASISGLTITGATEAAVLNRGTLTLDRVIVTENWIGFAGLAINHTGTVYNAGGTLVVQNSRISSNFVRGGSSGLHGGGGIESSTYLGATATLVVANSTISNNDGGLNGGGIWIGGGTATVTGSTITGNRVVAGGGGIGGIGTFTITVSASTISGNTANLGGGIYVAGSGTATITESTISSNTAQSGGGVYFGTLNGSTLSRSTVANNQVLTNGRGGGIFVAQRSTANVVNSTIAGNSAGSGATGGGIHVASGSFIAAGGTLNVRSSTVANNQTAGVGGGIWVGATRTQVRLVNTIVAGNSSATHGPDVTGSFLSTSMYNIIGDGSGATGLIDGMSGNQVGTASNPIDAQLSQLQDNGGRTQTMALLAGSPAIDAGDSADAPATDQRGLPRIVTSRIDIGAFEVQLN